MRGSSYCEAQLGLTEHIGYSMGSKNQYIVGSKNLEMQPYKHKVVTWTLERK